MRKESKQTRQIEQGIISGYHRGECQHDRRLVFASDRPLEADRQYRLSDGSMLPMFGIEIETQNFNIIGNTAYASILKHIIFETFPNDLWKFEEDCSLNQHGAKSYAECITQPMTKAFIRNHYRDFKVMFDWFKNLGTDCTQTGDCGMHTHISVTNFGRSKAVQDEAIRKFLYMVNKHYDFMMVLVNRRLDAWGETGYFGRMPVSKEECKTMDLSLAYNDHGLCINLGHYESGDIEFRLVGGQKNYACFRNTMESVFHLIEASKRISWNDCDDLVKIFSGCNNYVFDRISTNCFRASQITAEQVEAIRATITTKEFL